MVINELAEIAQVSKEEGGLRSSQIEHLYITLAMRLRESKEEKSSGGIGLPEAQKLAMLYRTCPRLLGQEGRRGPLPSIERLFCPERSHMRLQEQFWHYQMEGS